jgi:hypothetical protein
VKNINILNNLNSGKTSSYFTINGTKEFTCENNGYVDNVAIEGKTLVNLIRTNLPVEVWNNNVVAIRLSDCNYLEGTYTLFNFSDKTIAFDIGEATTGNWLRNSTVEANKVKTFNINNGEQIFNVHGSFTDGWENNDTSKNDFRNSIVLLEGDHTDKSISYFEGLKSVGQGDKIDVLTYPTNNENLITSDVTLHEDYCIPWNTGELVSKVDSSEKYYATDYIEVEPNTEYIFANINKNIAYYDANKTFIPMPLSEGYAEKKCTYFYNTSPSNAKYVRLSIKDMYIGKPYMAKGKYICDNKAIPTTLRSLPNGVKDTIEKRENKYVKVQRCGEAIFNGTENDWYTTNSAHAETLRFSKPYSNLAFKEKELQCVSDRFVSAPNNEWNFNREQVDQDGDNLNIVISRSRLSTHNENGLRAYLKENPLTVVYELATPIITELPNFNPQTYKSENVLIINSGVIQCDASFDVCEGIRSELDVIKDKVSNLTESVKNSLDSEMSNEINTIKNAVSNNTNEINTIKNTVSNNTNEINTIKNTVSTVQKTKMTEDNGVCRGIPNNNANDIDITGFWMNSNVANAPITGWIYLESKVHNHLYQNQVATDLHDSSKRWTRHKTGGAWSEWRSL